MFESNDLKTEFTNQANKKKIASSIIGEATKKKAASQKVKNIKAEAIIKKQKQREDPSHRLQAFMKNKLTKQFREAKKNIK
jgi:hypothetical protein